MSSTGLFFLALFILLLLALAAFIFLRRRAARNAGLPPLSFSSFNPFSHGSRQSQNSSGSSGPLGWMRSKFQSLKNSGSSGAYQQPVGGAGRRGLDPDEAWDARVGNEADGYGAGGYYEEQELGLRPGAHSGSGHGGDGPVLPEYGTEEMGRGRSRSREGPGYIGGSQGGLDERYDEQMRRDNPFGDGVERSHLRGVSPRPVESDGQVKGHSKNESVATDHSPTERRSMFHENM